MRNHWLKLKERKEMTPTFFTNGQLLRILDYAEKYSSKETVSKAKPVHWNGEDLKLHEAFNLAWMRARNLMFRRTLDRESNHWMIVSPGMPHSGIFYPFYFCDYSTPGKPGGEYIPRNWKTRIKEEVAFNVYKCGSMGHVCDIYVATEFPDNVVLLGMGYKTVTQFKRTGKQITYHCENGKSFEWPEMIPYQGAPTAKNYALIKLGE